MFDIDDIVSEEIQTLEDIISEDFCDCGDLLSEHSVGFLTNSVKCFGLSYNGTVYSNCRCSRINIIPFKIVVKVDENADNTQYKNSRAA